MVGYADNHSRDMYKLYNTGTKRVITTRDIKCPEERMRMFRDSNKEYLVPGIEEDKNPTS